MDKEGYFKTKNAWASSGRYNPEISEMAVKMKDGRTVQFFANRENNLIVVDIINRGFKNGREILRRVV